MLVMRLQRRGRKKQPSFRLVVQENTRAPQSKAVEILGFYNPRTKDKAFKNERIAYWFTQGVKASDSAHNLLTSEGIIEGGGKRKAVAISKKRGVKLEEKQKEAEEKKAAAAEAKKAETEAKTEAPETAPQEESVEEAPAQEAEPEQKEEVAEVVAEKVEEAPADQGEQEASKESVDQPEETKE